MDNLQCPIYRPPFVAFDHTAEVESGLVGGIRSRLDVDYPRQLIGTFEADERFWSPNGWCQVPKVDLFVRGDTSIVSLKLSQAPSIVL